jgi:predicted dehydrogenase
MGQVPPSEKVNLAMIGVGGRGAHLAMLADWWEVDVQCRATDVPEYAAVAGKWNGKYENRRGTQSMVNIVAMSDVDTARMATTLDPANVNSSSETRGGAYTPIYPPGDRFAKARFFKDYRVMLETMRGSIDGVLVCPPPFAHFHATLTAMQLGLAVYTEKPFTRWVADARRLTEAAKRYGVVTQLGVQGHSSWSTARTRDWILEGSIGTVREVLCWEPGSGGRPRPEIPIPASLDYDLWLNKAPYRPYCGYAGGGWGGTAYWTAGTYGEWGMHGLDAAYYALDLTAPDKVEVEIGGDWAQPQEAFYPAEQTCSWYMPARGDKPPVRVRMLIMRAEELEKRVLPLLRDVPPGTTLSALNRGRGVAIIGEKATIIYGGWGEGSRIFPEEKAKEIGFAPVRAPRVDGEMRSFLRAIKGRGQTLAHFGYSGKMAEMLLLGDVAVRSKNRSINWDSKAMLVTNDDEANQTVHGPDPRKGWEI